MNPTSTKSNAVEADVRAKSMTVTGSSEKLSKQIAVGMSPHEDLQMRNHVNEDTKLFSKSEKITKKLKKLDVGDDVELGLPNTAPAEPYSDSAYLIAQASTDAKVVSDAGGAVNPASSTSAADSAASTSVNGAVAASSGGAAIGIVAGLALVGAASGGGANSGGGGASVTAVPVINAVNPVVNATTKAAGVTVSGTAVAGAVVTVNWGTAHKTAAASTSGTWSVSFASADIPADGATTLNAVAKASGLTESQPTANVAITVDTAGPTLISSVADSAAQKITLTYSEALDVAAEHKPLPSAFTVSIAGVTNTVDSVSVVGSTVILSMHSPIPSSGAVSVVYRDPTAGDDAAAIQDAAGNDAGGFTTAVVADGYIRGAKVYIDTNNNGIVDDADTLIGTTDKNGNIVIPDKLAGGTLLVQGGVNIDTGVPNTTTLKAPKGSTSITPLTTLVQTVVEQQVAANPGTVVDATVVEAAMTKVATALGLTGSLAGKSLITFDPIAENNTDVQKAAAQVATIVALASSGDATKSAEVIGNLTTKITNNGSGPAISLENNTVLSSILPSSLTTEQKAALTTEISTASNNIKNASSIDDISNAQSQSLDKAAAAKPTLNVSALTNKPTEVAVKVLFENKATDGTAVIAGDKIQLKDGQAALGSLTEVTADDVAAGFKVIKVSLAGADGTHNLSATITDKANNTSDASVVTAVTVDTTVAAPVVSAVSTDNVVNKSEKNATTGVDVSGTAEAGASVAVTWGKTTKTVTATGGNWTANFAAADLPADGNTTVKAVATDLAGNVSAEGKLDVKIDTEVLAPVVADVAQNNIVNATEKNANVDVSGTAEAGASVVVSWGAITKTVTATGGNWTANFTSSQLPADGSTTVSAVATDSAGNVSVAGTKAVTVDTAVAAPVVSAVSTDNVVNKAEKNATTGVDVSGTAEAGASVDVTWGTTIKTVTATGGNWTANFTSAQLPADGSYSITAVATDLAGNVSVQSAPQQVRIDSADPTVTATIQTVQDNVPATAVTDVAKGATTNDNTPTLVGTLSATLGTGEVLAVYDGTVRLGTATVTNNTSWSYTSTSLANGDHSFTVVAEDTAANQGAVSSAYAFKVDATVPAAAASVSALAAAVNTAQPVISGTITGTLASGDLVKVFDDNIFLGNATVNGSAWTFTPTAALAQGSHKITAVVENAGGTQSALSAERAFTIDTVAPVAPVLTSFSDNSGLTTDNITNDKTVTFSMTAEAGSKLEVFSGTNSLGFATESSTAGTFSFTTASLADGTYNIKAVSSDAAGNSTASAVKALVIDATAPAKSVITDWSIAGNKINLVIAAETGTEVSVSKGGVVLGTATETSIKGVYNYAAPVESTGQYTFTTTAKDVAGNVSTANAQSAMFVTGDSLQTTTAGSLDLKVLSSTSSGLSLGLFPKFTNTGLGNVEINFNLDTSKVTLPSVVTSELSKLTLLTEVIDPDTTTVDIFKITGFNADFDSTPVSNSTAFAIFTLNWVSTAQVLNFDISSMQLDPPEGSTYSGLVNPSFRFTPGNGVATGTTGDDLIITGTGNVTVTSGAGSDVISLASASVNLTLTDFAFGTDHIDLSKVISGIGYTSFAATAANNVGVLMTSVPTDIATLISSKSASLDNKFGAWFDAATSGTNKGVLHLYGDTDPLTGAGHIAPGQIDIVIGANSTGNFDVAKLFYQQPSTPVI